MWAKEADYNASLLCYTQGGAGISTGECAFLFNSGSVNTGEKEVNAVVVGGCSDNGVSSARTVFSTNEVNISGQDFAGRFSIPHLQL